MKLLSFTISASILFFWACSGTKNQGNSASSIPRTITLKDSLQKLDILIDQPALDKHKPTLLIFYALPNGNSIAWTMGKKMSPGDDWHYDIQHIKAQTEYVRTVMKDQNVIVAYMATLQKSWPSWKRETPHASDRIKRLVDSIAETYAGFHPKLVLDSHSGGGGFIFGYLDAVPDIPDNIQRIAFIDSDYGYEDSCCGDKLNRWLQTDNQHCLCVLAYNDSVVIFNGKPLVSPTGGTWYRSKMMQKKLAQTFSFQHTEDTAFIRYTAMNNRIDIRLKKNPSGRVYHTEQVARNGFIHTILSGTKYEQTAGYEYWGKQAYDVK